MPRRSRRSPRADSHFSSSRIPASSRLISGSGSLANRSRCVVVFGAGDPHIPEEGRRKVADALGAARVKHRIHLAPGEHAFMRDEGNRYDPEASDEVWSMAVELFRRVLTTS